MLIAIEGIDGAGKTSIGKALSKRLNYGFLEKAIQKELSVPFAEYINLRESLKHYPGVNMEICALFFGINNIICGAMGKKENIVSDRYIASSYYWYGNKSTEMIYNAIVESAGKPALTIVLDVSYKTLRSRLISRSYDNANDKTKELKKIETNMNGEFVDKTTKFLRKNDMRYIVVNNENTTIDETVEVIIKEMHNLQLFP